MLLGIKNVGGLMLVLPVPLAHSGIVFPSIAPRMLPSSSKLGNLLLNKLLNGFPRLSLPLLRPKLDIMLWLFALMLPPGPALSTVAHFTRALAVSEFLRGVGMLHARAILSPMFQNFGCDGKKFVILARTVNSSVPFGARLNRKLTLCSALIQTKGVASAKRPILVLFESLP